MQEATVAMRLPVAAVPLLTAGVDAALANLRRSACDGAAGPPPHPCAAGENTQPNCGSDRGGDGGGERCASDYNVFTSPHPCSFLCDEQLL